MKTNETDKNVLHSRQAHRQYEHMSLDDMVGKYKAIEPINSVELKHKSH